MLIQKRGGDSKWGEKKLLLPFHTFKERNQLLMINVFLYALGRIEMGERNGQETRIPKFDNLILKSMHDVELISRLRGKRSLLIELFRSVYLDA